MACRRFLSFKPIDEPSWRKRDRKYECVPKVNEMIKDIVKYHEMWLTNKKNPGKNSFVEEKREMVLEFFFRLLQDQRIGLNDQGTFQEVFNAEMKKSGRKRERYESEEDSSRKKTHKELLNNELVNEQASNEQVNKQASAEQVNGQESLPSSLEAEDCLLVNSEEKGKGEDLKIIETINVLRGYRHLKKELKKLSDEEQSGYVGEIDVETCIQECHEILMHGLPNKTQTQPGKFSVIHRCTDFEGKKIYYPSYATEEIAFQAVDKIVLEYNKMVKEISIKEDKHEKLDLSLKCATVMLFAFLSLHPFSNGNGRLARLLCSHCLKVFCPFPTSIYNVFSPSNRDDYLKALVNARQNIERDHFQTLDSKGAIKEAELILEQKPNELCSLVIESNWFTWRQFLHRIGLDIELFDFEKKTREISAS